MAVAPFSDTWLAGQSQDLVVRCIIGTNGSSQLTDLWSGNRFRTEYSGLSAGVWTLYDFILTQDEAAVPLITPGPTAQVFARPDLSRQAFSSLREVCAGIGGISLGAQFAGVCTLAFLDRSELSCETIQRNGGRAIHADIGDRAAVRALHAVAPEQRSLLSAGIPCQSFSVQGSRQGLKDARGLTLLPILRSAWLLQSAGILFECVSEIQSHADAMSLLQQFADQADMTMTSVVLDLSHQWASRRRRWWAVLLPRTATPISLTVWSQQHWTVGDVIPVWPIWPLADEQNLAWTPDEVSKFLSPEFGYDDRWLDQRSVAPTALHSWGNPLRGCPCGCRSAGFSQERLLQSGLRGIGIQSLVLDGPRHIHPQEAGLLNGAPPLFEHVEDCRAALCMVGQLASPLQALWLTAQIEAWADELFLGGTAICPEQLLIDYKQLLLQQRSDYWLLPTMQAGGIVQVACHGHILSVPATGPVRARDLLLAERRLQPPGVSVGLTFVGRPLTSDAWLHFQPSGCQYELLVWNKRQAKPRASAMVPLALCSDQDCQLLTGLTGSFLFEHCRRVSDLWEIRCALSGDKLRMDDRLLAPVAVDVRIPRWVSGPAIASSDVSVMRVLHQLKEEADAQHVELVPPVVALNLLLALLRLAA